MQRWPGHPSPEGRGNFWVGRYSFAMHRLVQALDEAKSTRSRKAKVSALATLLKSLSREELPFASRLILGQLPPLGVGWALLGQVASELTGITMEQLGLRTRALGDFGDALEELLPRDGKRIELSAVGPLIDRVAATPDRDAKRAALTELFGTAAPGEAKYLAKAILNELRIGVQLGIFEEALAAAFGVKVADLRKASALTPDIGELALLAFDRTLDQATVVPGHVVAFMLATPAETVKEPLDLALTIFEDKLDGIRAQAHVFGGQVHLFARGQDEVTKQFPELATQLARMPRPVVLDGEIIAVKPDGNARPFQALQARLNRAKPTAAVIEKTPVAFVAYDVLFDGESLLARPWTERRAHLEALPVRANAVSTLNPELALEAQLDDAFTAARSRGNEGLMLKRTDAPYEAGRRGSAWRKVKRAFATLDVVVTRAERGQGRRAKVLSDLTFAVWDGDQLKDIGRAYSGLTDAEIETMTAQLEAITLQQSGPYHLVKPEIVIEVAFDGLQPSTRHDSGYALRFPRIARIRDDKRPEQADTLATVKALFEAQVGSGHREDAPQLGLFG